MSQIIHPYHIKFEYTDNYIILIFFPIFFLILTLILVNNFSDKSYFFAITLIIAILIYFFQFSFDRLSTSDFLESRYYALPVLLISIFYGVILSLTRFKSLLIIILIIFTTHSLANSYSNRIQHSENLDFKLKIISSLKDQIVLDKKNQIILNEIEATEINKINKIFQTGIPYQLITYLYQNKYFQNKKCLFSKEIWSSSFTGEFKCENLYINFFENENISESNSINIIKLSINYKYYNQNSNPWKFNTIEFKVNNETNNSF